MGRTSRSKRIEFVSDAGLMELVSAAVAADVAAKANAATKLFPQIRLLAPGFTLVLDGYFNTERSG
jgi:hypothetical protein